MADTATRFRIEAIVRGLENVEALKNTVRRLQSTVTPAAADLNKLRDAANQLGSAADRSERDLRTQIDVLREVRAQVSLTSREYRELTREINQASRQLERANGSGGRMQRFGQTAGAIAASGVFGGPEGLLGAGIGAAFGPAGALTGGAIGAEVGRVRQLIGDTATYASEISRLNIALREITQTQQQYAQAQIAVNRVVEDFNVPIAEATSGFTRLSASVIGAGGNVSDAERVFRGVSAAIKATGGSAQDVQAAITAMSQVFGKGKVSAEELQGQLGERLPGAVTKFAEATGRTLPQLAKDLEQGTVGLNDLMKFVDALSVQYEGAARRMADSQDESGARMRVSMDRLRQAIGETFKPIGSALQDSIADLADGAVTDLAKIRESFQATGKALDGLVGFFSGFGTVVDSITSRLPAYSDKFQSFINGLLPGIGPLVQQLNNLIAAGERLQAFRAKNPQQSGMFGRYVPGSQQQSSSGTRTVFQDPSGKGDLDTKALERAERERIQNQSELNRLLQEQLKLNYEANKIGKSDLERLDAELILIRELTRVRIADANLTSRTEEIRKQRIVNITQEYNKERARIDEQRKQAIEEIRLLDQEASVLINRFSQKTDRTESPLTRELQKIDNTIQDAISNADKLLEKLNKAGGLSPEAGATRIRLGNFKAEQENLSAEQRLRRATSNLINDDVTALQRQIIEFQNAGRELTTLDELKQKYLADWNRLDPVLRQQLETLAAQRDQLEENARLQQSVIDPLRNGLTQTFDLLVEGTQSWGDSLRSIAAGVLKDIAKQLLQILVIEQAIRAIRGVLGGLFPGGGAGIGSLDANIAQYAPLPNAMGNVFAKNGIVPFAMGGVVDRPTLFKFANGGAGRLGLMGEAGPEAIIPLRRGPDGKLGVAGGGGTNITVNVDAKGTSVQGDQSQSGALARAISQAVQQELIRQKRPGGLLAA